MELLIFISRNLGSVSFFASRPFLTAFAIALLGRWGYDQFGASVSTSLTIGESLLLDSHGSDSLPWILTETALMIFGGLALLEYLSSRITELRQLYEQSLFLLQPGSSFVVSYSYADYEFSTFLTAHTPVIPDVLSAFQGAGLLSGSALPSAVEVAQISATFSSIAAILWALLIAAGSWLVGRIRAGVVDIVETLDSDNDLGLQTLLRWTENSWVVVGALMIIILPIAALVLGLATIAALFLIRRYFDARERRSLIPCAVCNTPIHPCAPACPSCKTEQQHVHQVGVFGQPKDALVIDLSVHRLNLVSRKRCPACATQLKVRAVQQACPACGVVTFADVAAVNTYIRSIQQKLPRTLLVSFVCGLIPVIGIVPAVVYYRLSLIASLRGYLPATIGCVTRVGIRLINLCLLLLQPIPFFGAFAIPAMCMVNYRMYRKAIERESQQKLSRTFAPMPASATGSVIAMTPAAPPAPPQARALGASSVFCTQCGRENVLEHQFCMGCGTKLLHDLE